MDCRETLESLADLSADCLASPACLQELREHLKSCPPCVEEWTRFRHTLFVVSSTSQPVVTRLQTQALWGVCLEKIINDTERERGVVEKPREARGGVAAATNWGWLGAQPRWGWAALGGAVAVFGGVWLLVPRADAPVVETPDEVHNAQVIMFQRPPAAAYPLIDGHAAMAFDGFNDQVGSTMVSYSATAPINYSGTARATAAP